VLRPSRIASRSTSTGYSRGAQQRGAPLAIADHVVRVPIRADRFHWSRRPRRRPSREGSRRCATEPAWWRWRSAPACWWDNRVCEGGERARWCAWMSRSRRSRRMSDQITVLLVDDHALVRKGFRRMVEDDPRSPWWASGQRPGGSPALAGSSSRAWWSWTCHAEMDGVQATREILSGCPRPPSSSSACSPRKTMSAMPSTRAAGYISRMPTTSTWPPPSRGGRRKARARPGLLTAEREPDDLFGRLTQREKQILQLIAEAIPIRNRGLAGPQREHGGGSPRQPDGRTRNAPHANWWSTPFARTDEDAVNRREFLLGLPRWPLPPRRRRRAGFRFEDVTARAASPSSTTTGPSRQVPPETMGSGCAS